MTAICPECFGRPKSNCLLPRCPYRLRTTRRVATGRAVEGGVEFTAVHPDYEEDLYILTQDIEDTQAAFLQGTGRL